MSDSSSQPKGYPTLGKGEIKPGDIGRGLTNCIIYHDYNLPEDYDDDDDIDEY